MGIEITVIKMMGLTFHFMIKYSSHKQSGGGFLREV